MNHQEAIKQAYAVSYLKALMGKCADQATQNLLYGTQAARMAGERQPRPASSIYKGRRALVRSPHTAIG